MAALTCFSNLIRSCRLRRPKQATGLDVLNKLAALTGPPGAPIARSGAGPSPYLVDLRARPGSFLGKCEDTGLRDGGVGYLPPREADGYAPLIIGIAGDGTRFGSGYRRGQVLVVRTGVGSKPGTAGSARPVAAWALRRPSRLVLSLQPRPPLGPPPLPGASVSRPGGAPRS